MNTKFYLTCLLITLNLPVWGALYNYGTLNGDAAIGAIPDNSTIGFSDSHTLTGLGNSLAKVTLTLVLQGGFASDLSGYLRLGNLPGSTATNLTSLLQTKTLSASTPTTYTIDLDSAFAAQNPNQSWTLYFADPSPGGTTTLNGWSLDITAIPEVVDVALIIFGVAVAGGGLARRYWRPVKSTSI